VVIDLEEHWSNVSMSRRLPTLVVQCAFLLSLGCGCGSDSDSRDEKLVRTEAVVSRLTRDFYSPEAADTPAAYSTLVSVNPALVQKNETNRGAEILFKLPGPHPWSADTDGDGLPEACDAYGVPLIFFTSDFDTDVIVYPGGVRQRVYAPPYFTRGYYINSVRSHVWRAEDQEVLQDARHAATSRPAATTSRSAQPP
jgi:hypothetical protein